MPRTTANPTGRCTAPPSQKAVQVPHYLLSLQAPPRIPPFMNRRHFLASSLGLVAASPLAAIGPIQRAGKSRMQIGVAAYSFREAFQWSRGKEQKVAGRKPWSILDFIDWCADHNVPGAEVTSYFFPPDVDNAFLLEVRRHAYLRGVQLAGTAVGNNFALPKGPELDQQIADVKKWIDHAAVMGAPHIRVFAGPVPKKLSIEEAVANCTAAYQECLDYAGQKGVFLGLENHGGIVAEPDNLVKMVREVNSPWAGINFDSGSLRRPGQDRPLRDQRPAQDGDARQGRRTQPAGGTDRHPAPAEDPARGQLPGLVHDRVRGEKGSLC